MVEQYPECKNPKCKKPLFGPVQFCPYCGMKPGGGEVAVYTLEVTSEPDTADVYLDGKEIGQTPVSVSVETGRHSVELRKDGWKTFAEDVEITENYRIDVKLVPDEKDDPPKPSPPPSISLEKDARPEQQRPQPEQQHPPKRGKKFIIGLVIVVALAAMGFFMFHGLGGAPKPGTEKTSTTHTPPPPADNCAEAQALASDALKQGAALALDIAKIPNLENRLHGAQKLVAINPDSEDYKGYVAAAERKIGVVEKEEGDLLADYLSKVHDLSRRKTKENACANDVLRQRGLSLQEQVVVELLDKHVKAARDAALDPSQAMLDFNGKFKKMAD
jgi:hypothetical protein